MHFLLLSTLRRFGMGISHKVHMHLDGWFIHHRVVSIGAITLFRWRNDSADCVRSPLRCTYLASKYDERVLKKLFLMHLSNDLCNNCSSCSQNDWTEAWFNNTVTAIITRDHWNFSTTFPISSNPSSSVLRFLLSKLRLLVDDWFIIALYLSMLFFGFRNDNAEFMRSPLHSIYK